MLKDDLTPIPDGDVSRMILYILLHMRPPADLEHKLNETDRILESMIVDFTELRKTMSRRAFGPTVKKLVDAGYIFKAEYHGNKYVVNPFHHNVLTGKQVKIVRRHLMMLLPVEPDAQPE